MSLVWLRSNTPWQGIVLAAFLALPPGARTCAGEPLPAYNADIAQTSVSGVSSGAFMAVQFGLAWSSLVIGVGAVAGGPFGCSEGSGAAALSTCMSGQPAPDLPDLIRRTDAWSTSGAIDDTANVARQHIYLFSGYNDNVVARRVVDSLQAFYAHYLRSERLGNLFYQTTIGAGHALVTVAYGGHCASNGGEYINRCGYDQAGIILQHIYGALSSPRSGPLSGRLIAFDQDELTVSRQPADDSLDDRGFVYVPASCASQEPCRVHVVFHGCLQSFGNVGEDFVMHAGYNEWADTNRIIVLYPQIRAIGLTAAGIINPQACWDWWGYLDADPMTSPHYLLKSGRQISAIKAMIDRLAGAATKRAAQATMVPGAPFVLRAADASDHAIDLVWSAVPDATGYAVSRAGPDDADPRRIATVAGLIPEALSVDVCPSARSD